MMIHDASGAVAVVSAESVRIVGEGCIVLNARAVYIHNQALTPEQAAIVKRGVMATLDDPAALEDLHGKHDVASVDLPPRDCLGVDGDGMDAHVGKPDGFACRIKVGERSFDFDGLDMGDLQTMKGAINKAMTHARRARREWEGAQE